MKRMILLLAGLLAASSGRAQGFGTSRLLHDWTFHLGDDVEAVADTWRTVQVPHDWSVEQPASQKNASCTGYLPGGIGWYQTNIQIPATAEDQRFYLYFEGVYNRSEVFVNGQSVGARPNGYVSFLYDITSQVVRGGKNEVKVRVDHSRSADSRWYTGSGIYRPVHLITAPAVHLDLWGVFCSATVDGAAAQVNVETTVKNESAADVQLQVDQELLAPGGKTVAEASGTLFVTSHSDAKFQQALNVQAPQLWSIEAPNLYTLETIVRLDGKIIDSTATRTGIRTLTYDPDHGFALNGQWTKVKGVCLHHDAGVLGAAVPKEVWRARLLKLKEIGCNAIRMSHNPQATALYDLCDELGFLVMDEAFDEWEYPKKKWIEGWNKGNPGFQGSADFFEAWAERDVEAMIKRDRNHPAIIMWSIGNEVDYPNDPYSHPVLEGGRVGQKVYGGYLPDQPPAERLGDIAKRLATVVRGLDRSRPVTAALAGAVMSNETEYPGALDIVGYNYTEFRYETDHELYPKRILYGSETRHDLDAWNAVADNEYIFGQFIWTGFDYLGESGAWPSRGFTTGMIDLANNIKPRGYFRRGLWAEQPVAYLGTERARRGDSRPSMDAGRNWDYREGQSVRVVCYTNGEEAELFLNDEKIGERKAYDPDTAIIFWDIRYQPGELKVVVYREGKAVAEDALKPSGTPCALKVTSASTEVAGKYGVAILPVEVVDAQGQWVYNARNKITCTVTGNGKLLGIENASGDASENFLDNEAACNHGRLLAYVEALEGAGTMTVSFTAEGLESAVVELRIRKENAMP